MTRTLLYQSGHNWRFGTALGVAAMIHLAALSFARNHTAEPAGVPGSPGQPPEITFEPNDPIPDPPVAETDPLPTPPAIDQPLFVDTTSTPPPVPKQVTQFTPIKKPRTSPIPGSLNLSAAKVFAVSAPRPEYPYEARRQKITGEGIVVMNVDPASGNVTGVAMAKTTGSAFLDNAAIAGFKRWRFRPGTVAAVTCPVTFTLTGASY
jgi:TonB family protein